MPLAANATEDQIFQYISANYGPDLAGFLAIPDVRKVLLDAGVNDYTPDLVVAQFRATPWFRSRSASMMAYDGLLITQPKEAERKVQQSMAALQPLMEQLGIPLGNVGGIGGVNVNALALATQAVRFGWTEQEVTAHFAYKLTVQSQKEGLVQGSSPDQKAESIMSMARNDFFVPLNQQTAESLAIDVYAGRKTDDQVKQYLTQIGSSRFPGLAESGFTPGEYMAPIRQTIAEALELQPADVDFLDRRYSAVLEHQGKDGKLRPMTISESQQWARSQTAYRATKGARDEVAMFSQSLGEMFGKVG